MSSWVGWLLLAGNAVAFATFGWDKLMARWNRRRIRETTLLWWTLAGCVGAWLAMRLFRHKTRKASFRRHAALLTIVNPFWLVAWWWLGG